MDKGEDKKEKNPTNTMTISVVQLMKENVLPSFNVRRHRMNKCPLLRLVHSWVRRAS
jgi:hypothetical protein